MNCKRFEEELIQFAFGELEDAARIEAHLARCKSCRQELETYKAAAAGIKAMPVPAPSLTNERLRHAILGNELKPQKSPLLLRLGTLGASAAAVFAVWLAVGNNLGENSAVQPTIQNPEPEFAAESIEEFSKVPEELLAAKAEPNPVKVSRPVIRERSKRRTLPDATAVASGGAVDAIEVFADATRADTMEAAQKALATDSPGAIVVIQPDGSGASERSSNDVAIGG